MKKSTEELLLLLNKTTNISSYMDDFQDDMMEKIPLSTYLANLLSEKNQKKSDIIRLSGLDRGYAYDIFSGTKTPSRDKVLALCFAFSLSPEEVQTLLKTTEYPQLYAKIKRDSIILFAFMHRLSLTDVNELLYEMNYPCLI